MAKKLPPAPDEPLDNDAELIHFGDRWERGSELRSVLRRLPGELVLKSGQSGRRNALLERWDTLETPGLDGAIPEGALEALETWIHETEVLISYIVKIGKEAQVRSKNGRVYSAPEVDAEELPQVINSIEEAEFIDDDWCWPWPDRSLMKADKPKWDKGKLIKFGAVAGIGLMALVTYLDED